MTLHTNQAATLMKTFNWKIGGEISNSSVREYIGKNVDPDETVVATLLGVGEKTSVGALFGGKAGAALGGNYLLVTNKKIVVIKAGVGTWGTGAFGMKAKTFLYDHIASVDVSKGLLFGDIEIVSAGMVEKGSGGFFSGASKDSVVQFEKEHFDEVQKLAAQIRTLAQQSRQPKAVESPDIPEQIRKLASLRDSGVLTDEEFNEQKKKLLDKI